MPQPKDGTAVARGDLGAAVEEYFEKGPEMGFIGPQILPLFPVKKQAAEYPVIPKEVMLEMPDTKRAMRGYYNRSDWDFEMGFYATKENGWEEALDDRERALYAELFDAELICTNRASKIVLRAQEKRIADMVFNATNFTPNALTNEWDDAANATPIDDIKTGKAAVRAICGMVPTDLIVSWSSFQDLKRVKQVVDLLKYTFPGADINSMTTAQLAHVLDVERVLVGGAVGNTAKKGQDASLVDLWDNEYAMLTITAKSQDFTEPCLGRTFQWNEGGGGDGDGTIVEQYRTEGNRSDIYRVRHDTDERFIKSYNAAGNVQSDIAAAVSYLFSNVTT
jgi:hypothetical protein